MAGRLDITEEMIIKINDVIDTMQNKKDTEKRKEREGERERARRKNHWDMESLVGGLTCELEVHRRKERLRQKNIWKNKD